MRVPRYLYITITRECNLRCQMCHFWTYRDPEDKLTVKEIKEVIDQFSNINPQGIIIISGAEPTIHQNNFFEICKYIRSKGLKSACVTNGYDFTDETIKRLIEEGPTYITLSLDSHIPEIHNRLRGKNDAFDKTLDSIKRLVSLNKQTKNSQTEITVISIIFDENIAYLPEYIEFVRSLDVIGVLFQIINPTFAKVSKEDKFFSEHFFKNKSEAISILESVYNKYKEDPFVLLKRSDIEWFKNYINNPDFIGESVCDSHNKNIFLELCGDIVLCAHMRNLNNGLAIGNVRQDKLINILNSEAAKKIKAIMEKCHRNCGLLACHKREEQTN
ncbi:MAG: radical SAM protein [Deltaproteobacteria bacterium]|nr:radical SAM protein [Deltaproteobacteria bacterium]